MRALWNGKLLADSDATIEVENNHYFPPESVNMHLLNPSDSTSHCHWKGEANYYSIVVDGQENKDAAWVYHAPEKAAEYIKDYIAFWRGVDVVE